MNTKSVATMVGIATLATVLSCKQAPAPSASPNYAQEYAARGAVAQKADQFSTLEGTIVKVQESSIPFVGPDRGGGYSAGAGRSGGSHPFEYVLLRTGDGRVHTLIYPYSLPIVEGDASVKFRIMPGGSIDVRTFVDQYVRGDGEQDYRIDDNFVIDAEGAILRNGISYK